MASKSKRRRRVLGASCILAALIVASSSFAWFTSKDEVTNRLTANADYGVSIVESFTPPKNMLPGQVVNKDVYAVNTGNIDAFVKENVTGVLNYTYEEKVNAWDEDCVELTLAQAAAIEGATMQDGFKTIEAGGFLAWTNAGTLTTTETTTYSVDGVEGSYTDVVEENQGQDAWLERYANCLDENGENPLSMIISVTTDITYYTTADEDGAPLYTLMYSGESFTYYPTDKTLTKVTQTKKTYSATNAEPGPLYSGRVQDIDTPWTPTDAGVYIFRRSIKHDMEQNDNHPADDAFTYSGYYYDGNGKYYKIVLGSDDFRFNNGTTFQFDISAPYTALKDGENLPLTIGTGENDDIDPETGIINSEDLKISFVKEVKVEDQTVTFTYDGAGNRLVVNYTATPSDDGTYDASALAARAEIDYANAKKFSDSATTWAAQADAEYAYVKTLVEETNKLYKAAREAKAAAEALETAKENVYEVWDAYANAEKDDAATVVLKDALTGLYDEIKAGATANDGKSINPNNLYFVPNNVQALANTDAEHYPQVAQNYTELKNLYNKMFVGDDSEYQKILKAIGQLEAMPDPITYNQGSPMPETIKAFINSRLNTINSNLAALKADLAAYKLKYANLINQVQSDTTITVSTSDYEEMKNRIQYVIDAIDGTITTDKEALEDKAAEYISAYDEWFKANSTANQKEAAWTQALATYNTNVEAAKNTYEAAVPAVDDHGGEIVYPYSANKAPAGNKSPTLAEDAGYSAFAIDDIALPAKSDYTVGITLTDTTGELTGTPIADATSVSKTVADWDELKVVKGREAAVAKSAYDDAVAALQNGSTITLYVNLAEDYAENWTIDPADAEAAGSQDVDFYLNKVLAAGETSKKLIDSVEFAKTVTASAYKNLTFDLNVGLDSAQVTYADDQKTITTDAVVDPFALTATMGDDNETVSWA